MFSVTAFICCYNEGDIIQPVLRHLCRQGVDVHVVDNWSSDNTWEKLTEVVGYFRENGMSLTVSRYPESHTNQYEWAGLLAYVESMASHWPSDWIIHHDADEIRYGPWVGETIRDTLLEIDSAGFNAVNHRVVNFPPIDNGYEASGLSPEAYFKLASVNSGYDGDSHIKAWKNQHLPDVRLAFSAGHNVDFPGRKIFPDRFTIKHYPIRSQQHGIRKVFQQRLPRFTPYERARGWHTQYNWVKEDTNFLADPKELLTFEQLALCS